MNLKPALTLILLAQMFGTGLSLAQAPKMIGSWKVEITFGNGEKRSFRFEAGESGRGSFRLLDPRMNFSAPASSSEAKWSQGDNAAVTFSGPVEFPLGNVGRDPGTLILKGKSGTDGSLAGEATFFLLNQDPKDLQTTPAKSGTFTAIRITDESASKSAAP